MNGRILSADGGIGLVSGDSLLSLGYDYGHKDADVRRVELEKSHNLDMFLSGVEKRAFRIAQIATNNSDEALDIVQDAMFKLVEKYSDKDKDEWGALFHRILQSRIRDWYRRTSVRNRFRYWFSGNDKDQEEEGEDPFQKVEDSHGRSPEQLLETGLSMNVLEEALHELPIRQQQAFLLRAWEGLSVKQTAAAMSCAEGSVKSHYSRALEALRKKMKGHRQ